MSDQTQKSGPAVWFVYDGECPICQMGATHFRLRKAVGELRLLDARTQPDHPVMQEINRRKLDLDQGMVIIFGDIYYHGADALHVLAMLGTKAGWFNRINAVLFRSKICCAALYPLLRAGRNMVLRLKSVPKINNLNIMS